MNEIRNCKPVNGLILIEILDEEKSYGGIFIPDSVLNYQPRARVLAVSDDIDEELYPTKVEVGDIIYFKHYDGWGIDDLDLETGRTTKLVFLPRNSVFMIIEKGNK